jgi:hypothetical protein
VRWVGATVLIIVLIVVVGSAMAVAWSRGLTPGRFGGSIALITLLGLLAVSGLRRALIRLEILPEQVPVTRVDGRAKDQEPPAAWPRDEALERVSLEVENGRAWRAKEILEGHIGTYAFDPELYAAYGRLLENMGDHARAGLYLFLGGTAVDSPAVDLFLGRHREPQDLIGTFPVRAKLPSFADYPETVRAHLQELGARPRRKRDPVPAGFTAPWPWLDSAWVSVVVVLLLLAFVIGFVWIGKGVVSAIVGL